MCLIVIVEDLLAQEFSIECGKIFGISLSPLKDDIYVFSVVGHMLDTLEDAAAINFKKKSHMYLSSESPVPVPPDSCAHSPL